VLEPALSAVQSFEGATFPVAPFSCPPSPGQTLDPLVEWLIARAIVWRELPSVQRSILPALTVAGLAKTFSCR